MMMDIIDIGDHTSMETDHNMDDMSTQLSTTVADVFAVHDVTTGHRGGRVVRLRGQLLVEANKAYESMESRFRQLGLTPLLRREEGTDVIYAIPGSLSRPSSNKRVWVPGILFFMTVVSVLFAGAGMTPLLPREIWTIRGLLIGWPFALSLLSILGAHELGHYFVARRFGTPVSLPHFIPMPFSLLGTMGAVINMQGPPRSRRQLLAIAAAGPLAGLFLAVPILVLGLFLSEVQRIPLGPVLIEGDSLLYILLKYLVFGFRLPSGGMDVFLHPVAFAGWAGLMVTGINLIPAGQLDGGHIIYALLGRRITRWLNWTVIAALVALEFVLRQRGLQWNGWFLLAGLLFFFSQRRTLLLDEITDLDAPRKLLAILMMLLFALTFAPIPLRSVLS